jgi:hypothetical protein
MKKRELLVGHLVRIQSRKLKTSKYVLEKLIGKPCGSATLVEE